MNSAKARPMSKLRDGLHRLPPYFHLFGLGMALLIAVIWIAALVAIERSRKVELTEAHRETANLAAAFEEHTVRTIRAVDSMISRVLDVLPRRGLDGAQQEMKRLHTENDELLTLIGITDRDGNTTAGSIEPGSTNVAHRMHFRRHLERNDAGLVFGMPVKGQLTGAWTMHLSRRIEQPDGAFAGIVSAGVDLDYLHQFYREIDLGDDAVIMLLGHDGHVRLRGDGRAIAPDQNLLGKSSMLARVERGETRGALSDETMADGVRRIVNFRAVPGYPLIVIVGMTETEALKNFVPARRIYLVAATTVTGLILLLATMLGVLLSQHIRANTQLREREAHYRHLFEANPMPMWITHADTLQVLLVNEAAVQLYGYGRDEFARMTSYDFQPADGLTAYREFTVERRAAGKGTTRRSRHRRKDGSVIDVDVMSYPITYGGASAWLVIAQDITEMLRADAALRDREALLSVTIDRAPIGVNIVAPDGRFLRANPAFTQLVGYSEAELRTMSPFDLTHPDELPLNRRLREELLEGKCDVFEIEKRYRTKDGREIWVRNRVSLVKDDQGRPAFTVAAVQDITEIKQAEDGRERAFQAKAELAAIVETATVAIFTRTLEGTILSWNPGAEKMLGYAAAEAIGRSADFCLAPERRSNLGENNERLQHGDVSARESRRITSKGQVIDVLASHSPIRNEAGDIVGVSVILQDITALKRAQAAVQEREEQFFKMFRSSPIPTSISTIDDGRFIDVNDSFVELLGYRREELIGRSGTALGLWVDIERRSELRAQLRAGEPVRNIETQFRRKSGEIVTALYSREILQFGNQRLSFALRVDITERKRAEQELERKTAVARLLEALARAVNEAESPPSAIETCLELMCRHGAWDLGHFALTPTDTADSSQYVSVWHDPEEAGRFADFVQHGDDVLRALSRGGRFASVAIAERRPVWIADIRRAEGRFRLRFAAQAGLQTAFGFPVFVSDRLAAFVEFFSVNTREPDNELLAAGGMIAAQLARLIERNQAFQAAARLATIFEHAPSGIVQSDTHEFRVTAANPAFARMLGYSRDEMMGMPVRTFAHPAEPADIDVNRKLMMEGRLDRVAGEQMMLRKDGSTIWVNRTVVPVRLASGEARHFVGVYEDITERRAAEVALRESEQQMRLFMQATSDCLWNWDLITGSVVRSVGFTKAFGYSTQEVDPSITWWEERLHADDRGRVLSTFQDTVASGGNTCSYEYRFRRKDDTYAVINDHAYIVRDVNGKPVRAIGAMNDITERKASESALHDYSERLQALSRKVMEAQEHERAAIARELHDQLGQMLSAVKLNLQVFQRRHKAALAEAGLKETIETVDQALKQVRTLALDLRPPQLDELGLGSTLRSYAERLAKPARLKLHFSAARLPKLPSQTDIACFRVAQGALTNVVRHAQATNIWVTLAVDHSMLCLRVRDDGTGCDLKRVQRQAERGRSMGLISMEERTRLAGGRFTIVTGPGAGMEVHADFPLALVVDRAAAVERSA